MKKLHEKAENLETLVERSLLDDQGLIRSAVDINTMKPFLRGAFEGLSVHRYPGSNWKDFSEYIGYENVGMCSGAFLAAMVQKYRVTGDTAALDKAYRTFKGIKWLFDLSQTVEEGFYCKCYGGSLSDQISSDQYIYTMSGLDSFMQFADEETGRQCSEMIDKMAGFWIRRNYAYPYFGQPLEWPLERFPVFAWLAWQHTGKAQYRQEFERLCRNETVRTKIPFGRLSWDELLKHAASREPAFEFELKEPVRLIRLNPENTASGFLSLEALLQYDAPERELWLNKARSMFERDRRWIADDGYAMGAGLYHLETGSVTEVRKVMHVPPQTEKWRFPGFVGWIRSGMHAAMFARAAVALDKWLPGLGAAQQAAEILGKLSPDKLRWFADMDGQQFPPDLRWMHDVCSGDAIVNWLWAYWQLARCAASPRKNCGVTWEGQVSPCPRTT